MDSTETAAFMAIAQEGFDGLHARMDRQDAIQAEIGAILDRIKASMDLLLASMREASDKGA
jgi:hypothetical protein